MIEDYTARMSESRAQMSKTIICWDTHEVTKAVFYSDQPTAEDAERNLHKELRDMFMQKGMDYDLADDRARDFEILYVFEGRHTPIRQ